MGSTVIVALPAVDDKVNRISSEKVPHLTLMFLGEDQLDSEQMLYVQHAADLLDPFGLSVDYRGTLGPESADVLFFKKDNWDLKNIAEFRHYLLLDDKIKRMYDSVEQWPEWTPHVTLGYPATPAHEDTDEYPGVNYVNFDRIAVWNDDYAGPEFRLEYDNSGLEVAMSTASTSERGAQAAAEIFHYGTKGMKWGVRKAEGAQKQADAQQKYASKLASKTDGTGLKGMRARSSQKQADALQKRADKQWDKVDKKWEKSIYSVSGAVAVHNNVADQMNNKLIGQLNSDARWKDADLTKPENSKLNDEYMAEYLRLQSSAYSQAVKDVHGRSPSGKKEARYTEYETDYGFEARVEVTSTEAKHAEEADPDLVFFVKRDETGHISEVNEAAEGDSPTELKHYGVKGMRWGVRKDEETSRGGAESGPTAVVVTQKKPGKYAKAEGGKGYPLHPEAEAALATRQKARRSKTDALSNAELKTAIERMRLEQQFTQLDFTDDRRSRGARFVAGLFGQNKPTKYRDMDEYIGEETRNSIKGYLADKEAARKAREDA